jgi:hypothetical protein
MNVSTKKLKDVLGRDLEELDNTYKEATDKSVLPGDFVATVHGHRLDNLGKDQLPACFLDFEIVDGPKAGVIISMLLWLLPESKSKYTRELRKLGISKLTMLDDGIPPGIIVKVTAVADTSGFSETGVVVSRFEVDMKRTKAGVATAEVTSISRSDIAQPTSVAPKASTPNTLAVSGWSDVAFAEMEADLFPQ